MSLSCARDAAAMCPSSALHVLACANMCPACVGIETVLPFMFSIHLFSKGKRRAATSLARNTHVEIEMAAWRCWKQMHCFENKKYISEKLNMTFNVLKHNITILKMKYNIFETEIQQFETELQYFKLFLVDENENPLSWKQNQLS
jgi:hypothetical protein